MEDQRTADESKQDTTHSLLSLQSRSFAKDSGRFPTRPQVVTSSYSIISSSAGNKKH